MKLYLIGPVTGMEDDNRAEFERVREELLYAGHIWAGIPHDAIVPGTAWRYAMAISIGRLCKMLRWHGDDFGIAMLDGWENSRGARIERDLAESLGIPCRLWREWL